MNNIFVMASNAYSLAWGWEHLLARRGTVVVDWENLVALALDTRRVRTMRELRAEAGVILTVGEEGHGSAEDGTD